MSDYKIGDRLVEMKRDLDEAVEWIGVVREILVDAGGAAGDRTVALAYLRALVKQLGEAHVLAIAAMDQHYSLWRRCTCAKCAALRLAAGLESV